MNKLGFKERTKIIKNYFRDAFSNPMKYEFRDYWKHVYYCLRVPFAKWYLKFDEPPDYWKRDQKSLIKWLEK